MGVLAAANGGRDMAFRAWRRRWVVAAITVLVCAPALAGAGSAKDDDGLVTLMADHWCPHTCDPRTGRDGYMIDLAREAFALNGLRVTFQSLPWAQVMAQIRAGRADGAAGTLAEETPDLPTNQLPLGWQGNAVVVRAGDSIRFAGLDTLQGRRVAVVKGYSYSRAIDSWLADHSYQVVAQEGDHAIDANLRRLLAFQVDAVIDDDIVVQDAIAQAGLAQKVRLAGRLPGGGLHVSFRADDRGRRLAGLLDQGIETLRRSGRMAEIMATYGLADSPP